MFSQAAVDVLVQLRVPLPVLVIVTDWLLGLAPFCTAENEINDGFRPILGVDGGGGVTDVVGVMSCDSPGIAVASSCIPRPPLALFPDFPLPFPPGAATPANGVEVVDGAVAPLEIAPASESELVAVEEAFTGANVVGVVEFAVVVEPWSVVPSAGGAEPETTVPDVVFGAWMVAVVDGSDFLTKL
jgi:hypothetical protein